VEDSGNYFVAGLSGGMVSLSAGMVIFIFQGSDVILYTIADTAHKGNKFHIADWLFMVILLALILLLIAIVITVLFRLRRELRRRPNYPPAELQTSR
jgi:tetrahydromethanopterin S-methyltransferase subunit E